MEHKLAPIKREHIEEAAKIIDKEGMPSIYVGEYMVDVNGKPYHFKYITRLAYKLATGEEVHPDFFQSNKNYRQKLIDLGFPVINQNQNTMTANPFQLSNEKLGILLKAYSLWLSKNRNEDSYINKLQNNTKRIQDTFLNQDYLDEINDNDLKAQIKKYISQLDGPVGINLGDPRITDGLKILRNNFRYIIDAKDDPFIVAQSLIEGEKKIEYFSKAFWSPILQARYPEIIPIWNNKTENLLEVLGVNVKTNKLNTAEKLRKVSEAFQYLHQLDPKLDFFHLNHFMHYGYVIEEGKELVRGLLSGAAPDGSDKKQCLKIYEIKAEAPAVNYSKLKNKSQKAFFWNENKFVSNNTGDYVVVINMPSNEALFSKLVSKGIPARYNSSNNTSSFTQNGTEYSFEGKWDSVVHFEIIQETSLDVHWRWTKSIGQSEKYDLWKPDIDSIPDRIHKIDDLLKAFKGGFANEALLDFRQMLINKQIQKVSAKVMTNKEHYELIHASDFYFANARKSLDAFMDFDLGSNQDHVKEVISKYKNQETSFVDFLKTIHDSVAKDFFELAGKFIAHVDYNGANKNEWNTTPDKRIISKTMYTQKAWLEQLFKFKTEESFQLSQTVQTILDYLYEPTNYLPITSENHKKLIANALLNTKYKNDLDLTEKIKEFFEVEKLKINYPANLTKVINEMIYDTDLKSIWDVNTMNKDKNVNGLLASDSSNWPDEYIKELENKNHNHIIVWWDKKPSGGKKILTQLNSIIKKDQFFYLYITVNKLAKYQIKVVDFALKDDYQSKKWNLNEDVALYNEHFDSYERNTKSGKKQKAQITFLADEIKKLDTPIAIDRFVFYQGFQAPTQNNLQPYIEILSDDDRKPTKETKHNPLDILKHAQKYASGQGFKYDEKDIANFYLSLKTKPFVILAGISGTGKTKLVELFAESIGYGDQEHCVIIPVKPDWTDNSDLMGYTNLNKEFEKKKLTEVILKAQETPDEPFFIILDEMNLARVEYYFSDFLSIIETRSLTDFNIRTKPLLSENEVGENTNDRFKLINIEIPENLYVIGTVNMDETTFPFSKKVLDRANSIEMNQVELDFIDQAEEVDPIKDVYNDFLRSDRINSKHLTVEDHKLLHKKKFTEELKKINEILGKADLQFAYRIRDEMAFYLLNSDKVKEIISWEEAMDYQVMQKILPRIQGSAISISYLLINLINFFMGERGNFEERAHYPEIQTDLQKYIESEPKYSRTLRKLDFMLRRYSQDGFTSFWI